MATFTWQYAAGGNWYSAGWGQPVGDGTFTTPHAGDIANITIAGSNGPYTVAAADYTVTTTNHSTFTITSYETGQVNLGVDATLEIGSDSFYLDSRATSAGRILVDTTLTIGPSSGAASQNVYLFNSSAGTGVVTLSDASPSAEIRGQSSSDALINEGETIQGGGTIDNLSFANFAGIVDATSASVQLVVDNIGVLTNYGVLEATGTAGLSIGGRIAQQKTANQAGPGIIKAVGAGARVILRAGTQVVGGTLTTASGGVVQTDYTGGPQRADQSIVLNGSSAAGVTGVVNAGALEVVDNSSLTVIGNLSNSGTITIDSPNIGTALYVDAAGAFLSGAGSINIAAGAQLVGNSTSVSSVLQNSSNIVGAGQLGTGDGSLTIVNRGAGVINSTGGLTLDTDTQTLQNSGLIEATTGVLTIRSKTIAQTGGGTIASNGAVVVLDGVTVQGGTIASKSVQTQVQTANAVTYDGSGSQMQLTGYTEVVDASSLTLKGAIFNSSTGGIILDVPNVGTAVYIGGSGATLTGKGSIYSRGGLIDHAAGVTATLTNVDNLIFGEGSIGSGDGKLTLVNQYRIESVDDLNNDNGALVLYTGDTITNTGFLQAASNGGLTIVSSTVQNVSGSATGTIEAFAGSFVTLQSATILGGSLIADGSGYFTASDSGSVLDGSSAAVTIAGAIDVGDGDAVTLIGSIVNNANIALTGNNVGARIMAGTGGVTLTGTGALTATGGADSILGTSVTNATNRIVGSFTIGDGSGALTFVNQKGGVLNASDAAAMVLETGATALANAGLIESTGTGGLLVSSSTITNASTAHIDIIGAGGATFTSSTIDDTAGSRIDVRTGSSLTLQGSTIEGGVLAAAGTGTINMSGGTSVLDGSSVAVSLSGMVNIGDGATLTLNGVTSTASIAMTGNNVGANLTVTGSGATLTAGTVSMSGGANAITGTAASRLTLSGATIAGGGTIGDGSNGIKLIVNANSTINASDATTQMVVNTFSEVVVNKGLIEATGAAGLSITSSTLDQTAGGSLKAFAGSEVTLASTVILGGTLAAVGSGYFTVSDGGSALLGGGTAATQVSFSGQFRIGDGLGLSLNGGIANTGTFALSGNNAGARLTASSVTLTGGGAITLGGSGVNAIIGLNNSTFDNVDNAISGAGQIVGLASFTNEAAGVVNATGGTLDVNLGTGTLVNKGLVEATAGGVLTSESAITNTGTIVADAGTVTTTGAVTGSGSAIINHGGTLDIGAAFGQGIAFQGTGDTLTLRQNVAGVVSGFTQGDTIDLAFLAFDGTQAPRVGYTAASGGGTLTVTESGVTATLHVGGFGAPTLFALADDGHGGTALTATTGGTNTGSVAVAGGVIPGGTTLQNTGTITTTGNILVGDAGSQAAGIANLTHGTINLAGDVGLAVGAGNPASTFDNNGGTLAKTAGTGTSVVAASFKDSGGTKASIKVASGALQFNGATNSFVAQAISGAGRLIIGGGGASTIGTATTLATGSFAITTAGTTVTLGESLVYAGAFAQTAGTTVSLTGGYLLLSGSASFAGATINGSQRLYVEGATTIAGLTIGGTATVVNTKTVAQAGANVTIGDTSSGAAGLVNTASGTYAIVGDIGIGRGTAAGSSIVNQGTFRKASGTGTSTIGVSFTDSGTVTATAGTLAFTGASNSIAGALTGAGTVLFGGGGSTIRSGTTASVSHLSVAGSGTTVVLAESLAYAGLFSAGAGSALSIGSGDTLTLTGTSSLGGAVSGAGTLALAAGTTTLSTGAALSVAKLALSGTGTTLAVGAAVSDSGAFSQGAGTTLSLTGGPLVVKGSASFAGGTINGTQRLYTQGATTIAGLTIAGTTVLVNSGTITQAGGTVTVGDAAGNAAILSNAASGTYAITDNSGVARGNSASSYLLNLGLIEKTGGTGTSTIGLNIVNNATAASTIKVTSGVLDLGGTVSGTTTLSIGAGTTLLLEKSAASGVAASYDGASATLQLNDAQDYRGTIAGFAGGETLDLRSIGFGSGITTTLGYGGNTSSGTLTVSDGTHTAKLAMLGNYAANSFHLATDSHGGSAITLV